MFLRVSESVFNWSSVKTMKYAGAARFAQDQLASPVTYLLNAAPESLLSSIEKYRQQSEMLWKLIKPLVLTTSAMVAAIYVVKKIQIYFSNTGLAEEIQQDTTGVKLQTNHEERLEIVGYNGKIPDWAQDPVTLSIMNNPVMLKTQNMSVYRLNTARSYDESTVAKLNGKCALTRDTFDGYLENAALRDAIHWLVLYIEAKMNKNGVNSKKIEEEVVFITQVSDPGQNKKTYQQRLTEIACSKIPVWMKDPLTGCVMEEPVLCYDKQKKFAAYTIDFSSISLVNPTSLWVNPDFIYAPNRELAEAIEYWVSLAEHKFKIKHQVKHNHALLFKSADLLEDAAVNAVECDGERNLLTGSM